MKKPSKFNFKELIYLLPGLFGLFLMGVMAIPFLLILLFFSQEKGLGPVLIFLGVCLNVTLLAMALFRFRALVLSTGAKIGWLLVILVAPIFGPIIFLVKAQPVPLHLVGNENKYDAS